MLRRRSQRGHCQIQPAGPDTSRQQREWRWRPGCWQEGGAGCPHVQERVVQGWFVELVKSWLNLHGGGQKSRENKSRRKRSPRRGGIQRCEGGRVQIRKVVVQVQDAMRMNC